MSYEIVKELGIWQDLKNASHNNRRCFLLFIAIIKIKVQRLLRRARKDEKPYIFISDRAFQCCMTTRSSVASLRLCGPTKSVLLWCNAHAARS
jgi:hypothetical protein